VKLTIYNVLGQKVKILVDEHQNSGSKTLFWHGKNEQGEEVASGMYFFRLQAGEFEAVRQMILLR
jgi:flagellar hook assembly protein FlgD